MILKRIFFFKFILVLNLYSQWIPQNFNEIPSTTDLTKIQFVNSMTGWIVGGPGRVFKTTNGGANWFATNSNLATTSFLWSGYFIDAQTGWAIGNGGVVIKTVNGGVNWITQNNGSNLLLHYVHFVDSQTGWIVGHDGTIRKTSNSGTNWLVQNCGATDDLFCTYFTNKDTGWVSGNDGLFRTFNAGLNWTVQSQLNSFYSIYFLNKTTGWAGARFGYMFKTTNTGQDWAGVFTDPGATWYSVHFVNGITGWALGDYNSIIKTTNGGLNWFAQATGLPGTTERMRSLHFINDSTGWGVGFECKIIKTINAGNVGITNIGTEVPQSYSLEQNYPNPFNPVTNIEFSIPTSGNVVVEMFDATGRAVKNLFTGSLNAGTYKLTEDFSAHSSGIYFYRISSGEFTATKKMILIK